MNKFTRFLIAGMALAVLSTPPARAQTIGSGWGDVTTHLSAVTTTGASTAMSTARASAIAIHITSASSSSATVKIQQSVDGTSWYSSATITNPDSAGELWVCPSVNKVRVNVTARASGTLTAVVATRFMSADPIGSSCKKIDTSELNATSTAVSSVTGTFTDLNVSGVQTNSGSVQGAQTAKALTAGAATAFVTVTVPSGGYRGGLIEYMIEASDGTDHQARSGVVPWSVVNKAGTSTCTVGTVTTASEVVAVSLGTLTNTFTCADAGSGVIEFRANAASSLTETSLNIRYRTRVTHGTLTTVSAQ